MGLVRELSEEIGVVAVVGGEPGLRILQDAESVEGLVLDLWVIFEWAGSVANHAPEENDDLRWFDLAAVQNVQPAHPSYRDFIAGTSARSSDGDSRPRRAAEGENSCARVRRTKVSPIRGSVRRSPIGNR